MNKFSIIVLVIFLIGILSASHLAEQTVNGILLSEGVLPDQKATIGNCLEADFEYYSGTIENSFETYFENVNCEFVNSIPDGLVVYGVGSECVVEWCSPNENQTGNYFIEINASSEDYSLVYSFNLEIFDYKIDLKKGWNLISIPLVPENTSIEFVLGGIKSNIDNGSFGSFSVFQYDGVAGEWIYTRPTASGWSEASGAELGTIVPGYGYWINMVKEDTLYFNGEKMYNSDSNAYPPSVTLGMNNWNLIGVYGLDNPEIESALISLTNSKGDKYYDHIYNKSLEDVEGNLTSKEGYWVSLRALNESGSIVYKANYL